MLIYLRHGDDRGEDRYKHDRPLNDRGREKSSSAAKRLITKYGHPDIVHVSPFRRALETLDVMSGRFTREVIVHRDVLIAQHLTKKQQRLQKISPATRAQVEILEDKNAFRRRVAAHVASIRHTGGGEVRWCLTHQGVIAKVAEHFNVKISDKLDFLDHVVMLR